MLARPAPRRNLDQSESTVRKGQTRPPEERYRLRVDSQEKRSFRSKEAAVTAGQAVKKAFPVVMVTVVDAETGATQVVS